MNKDYIIERLLYNTISIWEDTPIEFNAENDPCDILIFKLVE